LFDKGRLEGDKVANKHFVLISITNITHPTINVSYFNDLHDQILIIIKKRAKDGFLIYIYSVK